MSQALPASVPRGPSSLASCVYVQGGADLPQEEVTELVKEALAAQCGDALRVSMT